MQTPEQISVNFRIKKLELLDYAIKLSATPSNIKNTDAFYFTTSVSMNFDIEKRYLFINILCKFSYDEVREVELGNISTLTTYAIEELDKFVKTKEKNILVKLPEVIMANFIGLSISTTRGMLAMLTKGTPFETAILPIQNPLSFAQRLGVKID